MTVLVVILLLLIAAVSAVCLWALARLALDLLSLCPDRARRRRMLARAVRPNSYESEKPRDRLREENLTPKPMTRFNWYMDKSN